MNAGIRTQVFTWATHFYSPSNIRGHFYFDYLIFPNPWCVYHIYKELHLSPVVIRRGSVLCSCRSWIPQSNETRPPARPWAAAAGALMWTPWCPQPVWRFSASHVHLQHQYIQPARGRPDDNIPCMECRSCAGIGCRTGSTTSSTDGSDGAKLYEWDRYIMPLSVSLIGHF